MRTEYKIIILSIIGVPIYAALDTFLIRGMSFNEYLYVCGVEVLMFVIGILVGVKIVGRENRK